MGTMRIPYCAASSFVISEPLSATRIIEFIRGIPFHVFSKRIFYHITLFPKLCQEFSEAIANLTINNILSKKLACQSNFFSKQIHKPNRENFSDHRKRDTSRRISKIAEFTVSDGISKSYCSASSISSIKIPYPRVGSFTKTWVTAPTSLPS